MSSIVGCDVTRERKDPMANIKLLRFAPIGLALGIGATVAMWPPLKFVHLTTGDFASRFSTLVFFSLLIERAVEIVMSIWRSEKSNKRVAAVKRLLEANAPSTDPKLVQAQEDLIQFRAETLQWTMPVAFALGLLMSALGVRALVQFVDPASITTEGSFETQMWWFNMSDILFTGALLAGGADPIHKLLDLYRKFVEASAGKASGTT